MKKISFVFLFLITILSNQYEFADWIKMSKGINGGNILSLASNDSNVFACTQAHGLFLSTDHGTSWEEKGLFNITVFSLAVNGSSFFAGTNHGVYLSSNNGLNWVQSSFTMGNGYSVLTKDSIVLVGTDGGIYRSTNCGVNWSTTPLLGFRIMTFAKNADEIYAGTYTDGIYLSADNGSNWTQLSLNYREVNFIYLGVSECYACTDNGLYKSTDNCVSWTQIGMNTINVYSFAKVGSVMLAGAQYGIYKSTNDGSSWSLTYIDNNEIHSLIADGNVVLAATNKNGIYKSENSGINWTQAQIENVEIANLCKGGTNLYSGTNDRGVFLSTNYGMNWSQIGFSNNSVLALTANDTELFISPYYNYGIYRTTNFGANWVFLRNLPVYSYAMTESRIYAGVYFSGLYYSTNNGDNWFITSLNFTDVFSLAAYGANVYAGTWGLGLYCSSNYGSSWINVLTNELIYTIFTDGTNVFVGSQNGLYLSTNNGTNWSQTGLTGKQVISVAAVGSNVIAGTDTNGVYFSSDNGMNWSLVNEGFNHNYNISSLVILNGFIYAGTNGFGVWRRNLSELIGINSSSSRVPNHFSLSQNYPNPFNPTTKIKFSIPPSRGVRGVTKLTIYDLLGREVAVLVNEQLSPGIYEVEWDNANYPSGVYFYKLLSNEYSETKKMVLIK